LVTAALAAAGCAPGASNVEIRPIADASTKLKSGGPHLALAKGQLALGNVGLALEGFRIALREQPASTEAYAGIAACYSAMGRFDLARQNYEAALAISPADPALLSALAATLDAQGLRAEAAEVRAEIAHLRSASAALDAPDEPEPKVAAVAPAPARRPAKPISVVPAVIQARPATKIIPVAPVVALPVIHAAPVGPTVTVKLPPARPVQTAAAPAAVQAQAEPNFPMPSLQVPRGMVDVHSEPSRFAQTELAAIAQPASASLTVTLPPARPVKAPVAPAEPPRRPLQLPEAVVAMRSEPLPHLERMSLGEVALITYDRPTVWRPQVVAQSARATTVRWVPLREASARPNIRLLNAARAQGLAARTRGYLLDRGWRKIAIGDAPVTRATSVVYYPAHRQATARSLAAQFGFRATEATQGNELVVLLGRDATVRRALQTRG
jgi:tetratricopeptide (TPR) repeat protein